MIAKNLIKEMGNYFGSNKNPKDRELHSNEQSSSKKYGDELEG